MRFADLTALLRGLDLEDDDRRPPRDNVRTVQDSLSAWLADEAFYLDCVELELRAVTNQRAAMFRLRDRPLRLHMFYWWPGRIAAPHEHTRWTVTAVFFNQLQITTYDWDLAFRERRLERKNVFVAQQGKAGHIYDRCIHHPSNHSNRDSMSLHIFNESDTARLEAEVGPIPGLGLPSAPPSTDPHQISQRMQRQLRVLAQSIVQLRSDRARSILDDIAVAGDAETQARIDRFRWRAASAGRTGARDDASTPD